MPGDAAVLTSSFLGMNPTGNAGEPGNPPRVTVARCKTAIFGSSAPRDGLPGTAATGRPAAALARPCLNRIA